MSASRKLAEVAITIGCVLFGGIGGALILAGAALVWSFRLAGGEDMNAGEGFGTAVLMSLAGAFGFVVGAVVATVFRLRRLDTTSELQAIGKAA